MVICHLSFVIRHCHWSLVIGHLSLVICDLGSLDGAEYYRVEEVLIRQTTEPACSLVECYRRFHARLAELAEEGLDINVRVLIWPHCRFASLSQTLAAMLAPPSSMLHTPDRSSGSPSGDSLFSQLKPYHVRGAPFQIASLRRSCVGFRTPAGRMVGVNRFARV